jgi:hypothetical protein
VGFRISRISAGILSPFPSRDLPVIKCLHCITHPAHLSLPVAKWTEMSQVHPF